MELLIDELISFASAEVIPFALEVIFEITYYSLKILGKICQRCIKSQREIQLQKTQI